MPIDAPLASDPGSQSLVLRPQKILIIEDDLDSSENLRDILELDGHLCEVSYSGSEALQFLEATTVDIILLDWKLSDVTAIDLLPRIQLLASESDIVIVTGHSDLDFAVSALRNGASDYLLKPINPDVLRNSLRRLGYRRWLSLEKQRSDMMFRQLVESAPCLIIILKDDETIAYFSPFAETLTGYRAQEVEGLRISEVFKDYRSTGNPGNILDEILASSRGNTQQPLTTSTGSRRWISWKTRDLIDMDGHRGILAIGQDMTEYRRATEMLVQSERLSAIGEAITGLAHESRNALQRSQAFLELLAADVQDRPEALKLVGLIQSAQNHLHTLYEEVRQYAAPIRLQTQSCDVWDLFSETWSHLEHFHGRRDASIKRIGRSRTVNADPFMMQQVFRNILENSLAACADPVVISLAAAPYQDEDGKWIRLSISDNGPGLNGEQRERIFDAFYTTKMRGTGLGMTLAKRIIEAHGGRILVGESQGTEIVIFLPNRQTDKFSC